MTMTQQSTDDRELTRLYETSTPSTSRRCGRSSTN